MRIHDKPKLTSAESAEEGGHDEMSAAEKKKAESKRRKAEAKAKAEADAKAEAEKKAGAAAKEGKGKKGGGRTSRKTRTPTAWRWRPSRIRSKRPPATFVRCRWARAGCQPRGGVNNDTCGWGGGGGRDGG